MPNVPQTRVYHPFVARGSYSFARQEAPNDQRYVGMFYWSGYWQRWDKVIAVDDRLWTVQAVDFDGNPLPGLEGRVRTHCTPMEACHFADKPFRPMPRNHVDAVLYRAKFQNA